MNVICIPLRQVFSKSVIAFSLLHAMHHLLLYQWNRSLPLNGFSFCSVAAEHRGLVKCGAVKDASWTSLLCLNHSFFTHRHFYIWITTESVCVLWAQGERETDSAYWLQKSHSGSKEPDLHFNLMSLFYKESKVTHTWVNLQTAYMTLYLITIRAKCYSVYFNNKK